MHFVRKVFLVLFSGLAAFFLFMTALDASVVRVAGSPEPIKQILAGSGIYESIIPNLLGQAEEESSDTNIAFGSEIIRSAAISTFSGQYLETTTSSIIDSLYRWLDGETQIPDFRIDLTAKKTELAKKVADGIEERVASLPKCTKPISGEFDAFSAKCRPANVSARQAANAIRQDFLNNEDFLSDTVIAADEIKSGSNTPLFADSYKDVPNVYQKFKASPLALGLVAFLALATVILLSSPRLMGLRNAGFILISGGVFLLLLAFGVNEAVDNKILSQINLGNAVFEQDIRQLLSAVVRRVSNTLLAFGGGYAILGGISAGGYYFIRHRQSAPSAKPAKKK